MLIEGEGIEARVADRERNGCEIASPEPWRAHHERPGVDEAEAVALVVALGCRSWIRADNGKIASVAKRLLESGPNQRRLYPSAAKRGYRGVAGEEGKAVVDEQGRSPGRH